MMKSIDSISVDTFVTSWGSLISSYVQKQVIKRIGFGDDREQIINEELRDILDRRWDQSEEAYEIVEHCEQLIDNLNTNTK